MMHSEFYMGQRFTCGGKVWQVTDLGIRTVIAVQFIEGWMNGPPFALAEAVFDENDQPVCEPAS